MKTENNLSSNYKQADRLLVWILWAMLGVSLGLAGIYDTYFLVYTIGFGVVSAATASTRFYSGTILARIVNTFAIVLMCALQIHQGMGREELHFGVFVALAFLLCYRDWKIIVLGAALIAIHHFSFNWLQEMGYGFVCLTKPGLGVVLIHAGYVVAETIVLCYLAIILQRDALQSAELRDKIAAIRPDEQQINLAVQTAAISSSGKALQDTLQLINKAIAQVQSTVYGANRENGKNRALSPATDPRVSRQRVIFLDDFQVQRLGNGLIRSFGVCRHRRPVRFKSQPR